ncbi:MAG: hypothetical protein EAZ30_17625 [Betaproteobacteria bacterium]|nr:MAG: hypothetical protein EAZ30_17625 [Betaproteobacteria bacterium]
MNGQTGAVVCTEDLAALHALLDAAYPENLRTIAEWNFVQLVEDWDMLGIKPDAQTLPKLALIALRQTERLSTEEGGNALYLNKGISYRASLRDRDMFERFTGRNYDELGKQHHISPMRVRQIMRAMRASETSRRQGNLDLT